MGRLSSENKYHNDLKRILNHRVGSPYSLVSMFLAGPFIIPLYDSLGNGIINGLRILPTLNEFVVIEIIASIILFIRVLRDYFLKKKIYPIGNDKELFVKAVDKLDKLRKKNIKNNHEYENAINNLIDRNNEILNQ